MKKVVTTINLPLLSRVKRLFIMSSTQTHITIRMKLLMNLLIISLNQRFILKLHLSHHHRLHLQLIQCNIPVLEVHTISIMLNDPHSLSTRCCYAATNPATVYALFDLWRPNTLPLVKQLHPTHLHTRWLSTTYWRITSSRQSRMERIVIEWTRAIVSRGTWYQRQ